MNAVRAFCFCAIWLLAYEPVSAAADAPPTPKQMIRVLLANLDIPLTFHPSCKGVGSEPSDANLGDYLSGLLANFTEPDAKNSIVAVAKPIALPGGERRWECRVEFAHVPQGDPFRYGVSFQMRKNGTLVRQSIRCTGSG